MASISAINQNFGIGTTDRVLVCVCVGEDQTCNKLLVAFLSLSPTECVADVGSTSDLVSFSFLWTCCASDSLPFSLSLSFSLCVCITVLGRDVFGTLSAGATLVLPPGSLPESVNGWLNVCHTQQITVWNSTARCISCLFLFCGCLTFPNRSFELFLEHANKTKQEEKRNNNNNSNDNSSLSSSSSSSLSLRVVLLSGV